MPYENCKVYSDGSHFIAIPPTQGTAPKRRKPVIEEVVEVRTNIVDNNNKSPPKNDCPADMPDLTDNTVKSNCTTNITEVNNENNDCPDDIVNLSNNGEEIKYMTHKEIFEELYKANLSLRKKDKRRIITEAMSPYFENREQAENFVDENLQRKRRNTITRRVRLTRKINLQQVRDKFNYFCTFTYSDELHDEADFKKKLRTALRHLTERKGWKFVGVWEHSPVKQRLHFHGIFYIPEGAMVGELIEVKDYSVKKGTIQTTIQNTYFNERFGRSDFKDIDDDRMLGESIAYLMKYMEKTGERIVYGGELPQYFKSDILDDDIICPYDEDSNKVILNDNFTCWDEGEKIGEVSPETIARMPKSN